MGAPDISFGTVAISLSKANGCIKKVVKNIQAEIWPNRHLLYKNNFHSFLLKNHFRLFLNIYISNLIVTGVLY